MCMSCGCGRPNDDHGDARHITLDELDQAAQAANISREQAAQNIMDCCRQVGSDQGAQSQMGATASTPA